MKKSQRIQSIFILFNISLPLFSGCSKAQENDGLDTPIEAKKGAASEKLPTPDTWEGRREQIIQAGLTNPFPKTGPWSKETFALAAYFGKTRINEADTAILDDAKLMEDPKNLARGHWDMYFLTRLYCQFGPEGTVAANRMSAAAQAALLKTLWAYAAPRARLALVAPDMRWNVWNSENHMAQAWASLWGATHILASQPDYANRTFSDGSKPAQMAVALDEYWKQWALDRASRGLFVEVNSNYNRYTVATFHNFYDFAKDPELKRRMGLLLDLYWADWALESIDGVRGGSRSRSYADRLSQDVSSSQEDAWLYFGVGSKGNVPTLWHAVSSTYRPPSEVVDLATHPEARGDFVYTSRRLGLADKSVVKAPDERQLMGGSAPLYHLDPNNGGILRSTYVTPDFVLGASMTENRDSEDWTAISSQNRWDGAIFAGNKTARIFVQPEASKQVSFYDAYSTALSKGVFVAQRVKGARAKGNRVWFDKSLRVVENGGWQFAEAPQAYAAVKVVRGETAWTSQDGQALDKNQDLSGGGKWLNCKDEFSPVVMEIASKSKVADFAEFQKKILANPLQTGADGGINYRSTIYATSISFGGVPLRTAAIDGRPVDFTPKRVYDSPYLFSDFGSGLITIRDTTGREKRLDFNANP